MDGAKWSNILLDKQISNVGPTMFDRLARAFELILLKRKSRRNFSMLNILYVMRVSNISLSSVELCYHASVLCIVVMSVYMCS